jgi:hypothetical protein
MKKIIFLTFLISLFASCNKDTTPITVPLTFEENLLLKGWSYDTILWNETLYLYDHNPDCNRDYFGFRNNEGQVYQFEDTYYTNNYCTNNTTVLRWEPIGSHINFYFGTPKVDEFEVISLTENIFTFTIDRDINNDGKKEHLIITAIPYDPYNSFGNKAKKIRNLKMFPVKLHFNNTKI